MATIEDMLDGAGLKLERTERGLVLTDGVMSVRADFAKSIGRLSPARLNRELLVRAAKVKGVEHPVAVDATAGLGEDSLLLAAAGFTVTLCERNPVVAALLEDALQRGAGMPELADVVARMTVARGDSVQLLRQLDVEPDVVFLDPMFPTKQKSSQVKKKLQLLQKLELPCDDEAELLDAAIAAHPRKVVIKRPVKGPHLAGRAPSYSLAGKAVRYDVIALAR